jgi:hypothetical protein
MNQADSRPKTDPHPLQERARSDDAKSFPTDSEMTKNDTKRERNPTIPKVAYDSTTGGVWKLDLQTPPPDGHDQRSLNHDQRSLNHDQRSLNHDQRSLNHASDQLSINGPRAAAAASLKEIKATNLFINLDGSQSKAPLSKAEIVDKQREVSRFGV